MKRKKINFKYLLLVPVFLFGINAFAQQKQATEKVSAKEFTTDKIVTEQQSVKTDVPVNKAEFDNAIISDKKQEAAGAGRIESTTPNSAPAAKTTQPVSTDARAVEKYDRELISNKKPANYDADKKQAPTISNTKPTKK